MKTNLSLHAAMGLTCLGLLFTACAKEEQVVPATMIPALTDDHRESRSQRSDDQEKPVSVHIGLTPAAAGEVLGQDSKLTTKKPTTICLECDPKPDGHFIRINDVGVR